MAKHNDNDQFKLWGTTRSRLMEIELTGRKQKIQLPEKETNQQQLDLI